MPKTGEEKRLAEQLQVYRRTGRVTKGLIRAGYAPVRPQDYVVKAGDSPLKVARKILGAEVSESQVAAFAQVQGWTYPLRPGQTLSVRGVTVEPGARPSLEFMNRVTGGTAGIYAASGGTTATATPSGTPFVSTLQPSATLPSPSGAGGVSTTPTTSVGAGIARQESFNYFDRNRPTPVVATPTGGETALAILSRPVTTGSSVLANALREVLPTGGGVTQPATKVPVTPTTPTAKRTESPERRFTTGALAEQFQLTQAVTNLNVTRAKLQAGDGAPPISINATVLSQLDPKFVSDLLSSGLYIQYPNGSIVLDTNAYALVSGIDLTEGIGSLGGGEISGGLGKPIGVSAYRRPRRGGVGETGTSTALNFDGGASLTNWRYGF